MSNVQYSLWIVFHSAQMLSTSGSFNKNKQLIYYEWIHSLCQVNTGCWCSMINEWQPPSHPEPTRIISQTVYELIIKILWKSFCSNFDFNYPITSQFCAKWWPDWIIFFINKEHIFTGFGLFTLKVFMEHVEGSFIVWIVITSCSQAMVECMVMCNPWGTWYIDVSQNIKTLTLDILNYYVEIHLCSCFL